MARWKDIDDAQSSWRLDDQKDLIKEKIAAKRELDYVSNPLHELEARQDARRDAEHDRDMAARKRAADSRALTAVSDPGRYNPLAVRAAQNYLENRGFGRVNREFNEMQNTERQKDMEKARGMIGQGADAARHRAAADQKIAEINAASAERLKQQELAAQKELGKLDAETKKYGIDAEHGSRDVYGTLSEGSRERIERIRGDAAVESQREAAKGVAAKAEAQRMQKMDEWAARAKIQLGNGASSYTNAQVRGMASIIAKAYEAAVTPEDRAKITEQLKEQYKNNPLATSLIGTMDAPEQPNTNPGQGTGTGGNTPPQNQSKNPPENPKEGDTFMFRNGKGVWRNGKWVLVK